ncbi:MAG: hypothetical protein KAS32_30225 [Candidatus Peribacteraceae bacterium]|nr:hypothetical protein [Candidatus Peribacteraceae bacterium]
MKRSILIKGIDKELVLNKAVSVRTDKEMIHLDKLDDGTWRLIYNENLIPDFSLVESFDIRRED